MDLNPICVSVPGDVRPYLKVCVNKIPIVCLLDSGASQSVIGKSGLDFLSKNKIPFTVMPLSTRVTTADGVDQQVLGEIELSLSVSNITRKIRCIVVPSVTQAIILGMDFGYQFNISLNFSKNSWHIHSRTAVNNVSVIQSRDELSSEQQNILQNTVDSFRELVSDTLGRTKLVEHYIDTGDARPFKQRQYLLSPAMQQHLHKEVDDMLRLGVIRPSKSPWSSPILLVKKANGELRACFDGRKLNSVTVKDSYPLPRIDSILNRLRDSRYLSSIDLRKAFWQIPLEASSCEKTAFTVPNKGLFEFVVMPFGLSNSPQTLQRTMERILGPDLLNNQVFVYLDDVIIASPTFEEHIKSLNYVRERLADAGFRISLDKCQFCRPFLSYLGYIVDQQGLRTDPSKITAILDFKSPSTSTEIKRLLGMFSYYRRFIPNFSTVASPITSLLHGTKKGQPIVWTSQAEESFNKLKTLITSAPVLASPDFNQPFFVQTDASNFGLGAVLFQKLDNQEHPIAFASKTLSVAERKYSATEKELLAVIFGIEHFRGYIEGTKFTVITDCSSLTWLHNLREPTGRLSRWCLRLSQFTFEVQHRPGTKNVVPDALSRHFDSNREPNSVIAVDTDPPDLCTIDIEHWKPDDWYLGMIKKVSENPVDYPDFKVENNRLFKHLPSLLPISTNIPDWKLVVPTDNRADILFRMHDLPTSGHLGIYKTLARISDFYYWPKLRQSVRKYVANCKICAAHKSVNQSRPGLMGAEKDISYPFQAVSMDLVGPLPKSKSGHQHILVVTDYFTKFVMVHPLRKATTKPIIKYLKDHVFYVFGVPEIVICDNGVQFRSKEFTAFMDSLKINKVWYNCKYHPQANPTERVNRVLITALSSFITDNHRTWDEHLSEVSQALRLATHEVTQIPPSFLVFGRHVPVTGDFYRTDVDENMFSVKENSCWSQELSNLPQIFVDVKKRLHQAYEVNSKHYNLRKRSVTHCVGDIVWKKNQFLSDAGNYFSKKLAPKFSACKVIKVISPLVYELSDLDGNPLGRWHVKDLKSNYCDFSE